jgi:CheY-like chemotaxis protein
MMPAMQVLIADDEPHVLELVRITLEDERVQVTEAQDGETALALAHALRPDVILLDVEMPGLDGLEVCRRLRMDPAFTDTAIVMLTAAAQRQDVERGLAAGADEYLTKPFSPIRLLSLLERLKPSMPLWIPQL